ncbi:hypothetical protein [Shinella fusca]|jgi:hypothetical protein|uniref:Uncharacterized protein n=1 Tax=Shinella fusca TaxID=544480 RepID=A0A7W7YYX0_9HYPH|nr:hypothetical protein [Shinella fusca]MBB5044697.1 hypothetical protein [Shinella fusca]
MRRVLLAVFAATFCHAPIAAAWERPAYDPVIETAAIAILQKKLPELRKSLGINDDRTIVRRSRLEIQSQGVSADTGPDSNTPLAAL